MPVARAFMGIETYQVVPPSGLKKNQMSIALAVVVRASAPLGNLNVPPDSATDRPAVPSFVRISVKDVAREAVPFGLANVNVQLPVSVDVNTVPLVAVMVADVPELPRSETRSEKIPESQVAVTTSPVPLGVIVRLMFESVPSAASVVPESVAPAAATLVSNVVAFTVVALTVVMFPVVAVAVVNVPAAGLLPPIVAPSTVPPLISAVAAVKEAVSMAAK